MIHLRFRNGQFLAVLLVGICLNTAWSMDASSADNLAASILSQWGRSKGVVAIPNCANGQLARAFLVKSGMKVHASDPLQTNVDATRQLVEPLAKNGPFITIDKLLFNELPYLDRFADIIVIANLADADLSKLTYAEVQRALAPDGLAFVGRATSEGAGITQGVLQAWIDAASKTRSTAAISTNLGIWAVITGKELKGVDVWTNHHYNTAGNRYSKDSVAGYPWLPQAKMKPYIQVVGMTPGSGGTTVTSGGRIYEVAQDVGVKGFRSISPITFLRAYSVYNGELLWMRDVTNESLGSLVQDPIRAYGRDVYLMRGTGGILQVNGISGADVGVVGSVPSAPINSTPMPTNGLSGCGPYSATPNFTINGTGLIGWDFKINAKRSGHFYKPPCKRVGAIISNGMSIFMRPTCNCGSSRYWGSHIEAPAGNFQFDQEASATGSERLEKGSAFGAVSSPANPDNLDWPTHRGNNDHSGYSQARVSIEGTANILVWNYKPLINYITEVTKLGRDYKPDFEPSLPAVVNASTYIGGTDCYLRCIDNRTGKVKWSYLTGGRIMATPTIANGCAYIGSYDGYVYCIDAADGRLVWRFRGAPVEKRMNLFGIMSSPWPVMTGVLVDGSNNAYFAAGLQCEYGVAVFCLNALTGVVKWQNHKTMYMNPKERMGFTPSGYMTITKQRLIIANSVIGPACFDVQTGALDSTFAQFREIMGSTHYNLAVNGYPPLSTSRQREVGNINDKYVYMGGGIIFRDHTFREEDYVAKTTLGFYPTDTKGTAIYPKATLSNNSSLAAAWDTKDFYATLTGTARLVRVTVTDLDSKVNELHQLTGADLSWGQNNSNKEAYDAQTPAWWPPRQFTTTNIWYNSFALTPNAIVATYTKAINPNIPEIATWYVGVLDRNTSTVIWEKTIPDIAPGLKGEPVRDGIAVDRNGNIIIVLRNGNVLCYGAGTVSVLRQLATDHDDIKTLTAAQDVPAQTAVNGPVSSSPINSDIANGQSALAGHENTEIASPLFRGDDEYGPSVINYSSTIAPSSFKRNKVDMSWKSQSPCFDVVSVAASSMSSQANKGSNTIDRDLRTRWSPASADKQWIIYDLGKVREVSSASLVWFGSRKGQTVMKVELSDDAKVYKEVDTGILKGHGSNTTVRAFVPQDARFVKITLSASEKGSQISLQEVGIHGSVTTGMK